MIIRRYNKFLDESKVMEMIALEEGWDYSNEEMSDKYKKALEISITYVAYENDEVCGYSRSLNDCGFYIYVCDLLVKPKFRGMHLGRKLMECLYCDFPGQVVYVMSDVDKYYEKVGFEKAGSVFLVSDRNCNI